MADLAPGHGEIERIVAPNPGPMTLAGTNTYLYGSDPCVVIDPGPDDAGHITAVASAAGKRGGIAAVLLTHGHGDHSEGAVALATAAGGVPVVLPAADVAEVFPHPRGKSSATTAGGSLRALATPGHAPDHVVLITPDGVCFSGDLVLGAGSTIVPPDGGSLAAYMDSLRRVQSEQIELICPGHGPWITDPAAKLAEYVEHREMREHRLLAAIERGAWDDVPENLRPAAAMVMDAHLQKLEAEGRLDGVELSA
jgi:glyoxylase-like metal-dependent hydrolase (beta-lactamase superfamily II)